MRVELSYEEGADVENGVATRANKRMPARSTLHDGDLATEVAVTRIPALGTYIAVLVNGLAVPEVGDGTKFGASCYFSGDGGATARAWSQISQGDTLHWQGSIAGYELAAGDEIDLFYEETI